MEIIGRISKGSRMDQIYLPKNRNGLAVGSYVFVKPAIEPKPSSNPYLYNLQYIEPIKLEIVKRVIGIIDNYVENDNIIITGSFLNRGFNFGDLDVILVTENSINERYIEDTLHKEIGIKAHLIKINGKALVMGLESDPLFEMMLSRCISKKRLIYNIKRKINYKLLDLHLLKSKTLIDSFDLLNGNEKYYLTRNMMAIDLFIKGKKIDINIVDKEISKVFNLGKIDDLKNNILNRNDFLTVYISFYNTLFKIILKGIKDVAK